MKLSLETLKQVVVSVLTRVEVPEEDAFVVADNLVSANLRGNDSHGIRLLPLYVKRIQKGLTKPRANITVVRESPCTALMNGNYGLGQVTGVKAMEKTIEKAKDVGMGAVGVFNTNHFGIASYYSMMAMKQDMIGVSMCNGAPTMAPTGGKACIIGNNPISYAVPAAKEKPIVLDMAVSTVAMGKIFQARDKGEKIPLGWAIDEEGNPTTDPNAVSRALSLNIGVLLPIGGYKGYGMAVVNDILSGVLTGAGCLDEVKRSADLSGPAEIGNLMMAIDIEHFTDTDAFKRRVDKLVLRIKNSQKLPGVEEIYLPGEIEFKTEEQRLREGIPVSDLEWKSVLSLAEEMGVSAPRG